MEKRMRVYLDTSVISALFDSRAVDRQNLTKSVWETIKNCDVYISGIVLEELSAIPDELKNKFLKAVEKFSVLTMTMEVENLAKEYMAQGIFPEKYMDDAIHVAIASVNGIDYLLSWNFKHLVKVKTRRLVALVNIMRDYKPVEIIAPPEL